MKHRLTYLVHTIARFGFLGIGVAALYAAFLLRFDFEVPSAETGHLRTGLIVAFLTKSLMFMLSGAHRVIWRSVGVGDLMRLVWVNCLASAVFVTVMQVLGEKGFPRSTYVLDLLLCLAGTAAIRLLGRVYAESHLQVKKKTSRKRILIYGAGQAGMTLAREIATNPSLSYNLIGFIDDSPMKREARVNGVPVLGTGRKAAQIVSLLAKRGTKISEIVIAMPSAGAREMQEALANCRSAGLPCKTVPGLGEMLTGKVLSAQIRDVSVHDLLGRAPVNIEEARVRERIRGRAVLVTGAAGSIGSELCRQVAAFEPGVLVAFDQSESELFRIDAELQRSFPDTKTIPVLGDIRDSARVRETLTRYSIDSIFHAAAYKHVPMIEAHPLEAARNNIIGTYNLVQAAYDCAVGSFLMVSTDKAVNPSSIMGATKRVDELVLSSMPTDRTRFISTRFGNVLGSNGSVIPTFQAQIAAGGPVTVTHPEMKRYFMTIREAVQLVLLASTMGKGSEVFVLDMGEPVRIVDLARQMIRLAGKEPDEEIEIRFTGLRAGEKLYEEINTASEQFLPTSHKKIRILRAEQTQPEQAAQWIAHFQQLIDRRDERGMVAYLKTLIPEFQCDNHWLTDKTTHRVAAG